MRKILSTITAFLITNLLLSTSAFAASGPSGSCGTGPGEKCSCSGGMSSTLDQVANCIYDNLTNVPAFMGSISYVVGIVIMLKAVFDLHKHTQDHATRKGSDVSMKRIIVEAVASAFFLALPTFLKVGVNTFGFNNSQNFGGY